MIAVGSTSNYFGVPGAAEHTISLNAPEDAERFRLRMLKLLARAELRKEHDPQARIDIVIIGAGMAGLTVAALLAADGRKVLVVEAHDTPGGYAHTFAMGDYRFCAQVHYIFGCGEGETVHEVLRRDVAKRARRKEALQRLEERRFAV